MSKFGFLFLALFVFAGVSAGAQKKYANKIHFLLAMDTEAENIGDGVQKTHQILLKVLSEIRKGREEKVNWTTLSGDALTPMAVIDFYRNNSFSADTAIVLLYNGHGSLEGDDHYLEMSAGPLRRKVLRDVMEETGTVLQVILTDSCANEAGVEPPNRRIPAEWKVFEQLFLYSQGMVDINSSRLGEFSWVSRQSGALFSQVLATKLCEKVENLDTDDDGFVTWVEFERSLSRATQALFLKAQRAAAPGSEILNYTSQTPYAWYLNDTSHHRILRDVIVARLDSEQDRHVTLLKGELKTMAGVTKPRTRAYAISIANAYRQVGKLYEEIVGQVDSALESVEVYEKSYQARLSGDAKALREKGTSIKIKLLQDVLRCQSTAQNFERSASRLP